MTALHADAMRVAAGWFRPDALPTPLAGATEPLVAPALAWARTAYP